MLGPPAPQRAGLEVLVVGTLSKTLGSLGGFVAGPRALRRPAREQRALVHLHHRVVARGRRRGAGRRSGSCAPRRATGLEARLRANVTRLRPGHPSPIVPIVLGEEARAVAASRGAARTRVCWCPRSGRPRCRRAPRACASRSRRRTRRSRWTPRDRARRARLPRVVSAGLRPRTLVVVAAPPPRWARPGWRARLARGAARSVAGAVGRAQARAVLRPGRARRDRRRAARGGHRRGAGDGVPAARAGTRRRWRRRWPPRRSAGPRFALADLARRARGVVAAAGARRRAGRAGRRAALAARARRRRRRADARARTRARAARRRRRARHDQRRAARGRTRFATAAPLWLHLNRYDATNELHRRNRAWLAERERVASQLSTDLDALRRRARSAPPGLLPALRPRALGVPRLVRAPPRPPALLPPLRPQARRAGLPHRPPRPLPQPTAPSPTNPPTPHPELHRGDGRARGGHASHAGAGRASAGAEVERRPRTASREALLVRCGRAMERRRSPAPLPRRDPTG